MQHSYVRPSMCKSKPWFRRNRQEPCHRTIVRDRSASAHQVPAALSQLAGKAHLRRRCRPPQSSGRASTTNRRKMATKGKMAKGGHYAVSADGVGHGVGLASASARPKGRTARPVRSKNGQTICRCLAMIASGAERIHSSGTLVENNTPFEGQIGVWWEAATRPARFGGGRYPGPRHGTGGT